MKTATTQSTATITLPLDRSKARDWDDLIDDAAPLAEEADVLVGEFRSFAHQNGDFDGDSEHMQARLAGHCLEYLSTLSPRVLRLAVDEYASLGKGAEVSA